MIGTHTLGIIASAGGPAFGTYEEEVLADSPIAWWRLDETSGSTAVDAIDSSDGTYAGGETLDQPPLINAGRSVLFNGAGSGITVPDDNTLELLSTPFTIECWIQTDSAVTQSLVGKAQSGTVFTQYALTMQADGTISALIRQQNASSPQVSAQTVVTVNDGAPHHLAMVFVPNSTLTVYIDGVERASTSHSISRSTNTSADVFLMMDNQGANPLVGYADEVAIYESALSPERIAAHYNAGIAA